MIGGVSVGPPICTPLPSTWPMTELVLVITYLLFWFRKQRKSYNHLPQCQWRARQIIHVRLRRSIGARNVVCIEAFLVRANYYKDKSADYLRVVTFLPDIHSRKHTHIHTHTHTHIPPYTYTRTQKHTHTITHILTFTHIHSHTHIWTLICTHSHTCSHTYTDTHTHT